MNKTKILYFEPSSGYGGSSSNLHHFLKALDRSAYLPTIAVRNLGPQIKIIRDAEIIHLPGGDTMVGASYIYLSYQLLVDVLPESFRIKALFKKFGIQLVHINTNIMTGISAIIAAKLSKIPCICHIRETRHLTKLERIFARYIDRVVVLNDRAAEICRACIQESKIIKIYDGIDLDFHNETGTNSFRNSVGANDTFLIGIAGRIVQGKGHKEFLLTATELLKRNLNTLFVIIGAPEDEESPYFRDIKSMAEDSILKGKVIFTGWRDDIKEVIASLDLLVHPTTTFKEGLPNAILEAMALGKPVVASDIAGPDEIIEDTISGFLVKPGDIEAMTSRIETLMKDRQLCARIGDMAVNRIRDRFSISCQAKKLASLYMEVLESQGK